MAEEQGNLPAITKRSFVCPHCGAFAGQGWFRVLVAPCPGDGMPLQQGTVMVIAHVDTDKPEYRSYAMNMQRARLPFLSKSEASWKAIELLNSAISHCSACGKVAFWAADSLVFPLVATRSPAPTEVPADLGADFNEAGSVLPYSAKASAALSRRCLQALLRDQGYNQSNLAHAIDAVLASKTLPSGLAENVDSIRIAGNFAAHPLKDTNTGEIIAVEPHEAEWNLEVLEGLFDFYYVEPAKNAKRRAAFNAKVQSAGKPPMK